MSVLPQWDEKRSRALRSVVPALPLLFLASAGDDTARTPALLLIGIDRVRPDVLAEVSTPNLDRLAAEGSYTAETTITTSSVSGPAWSSMLTGVWPDVDIREALDGRAVGLDKKRPGEG